MALDPVRPVPLDDIEAARPRIAGTILRTPLVRLELGPGHPEIHLKLGNLQPINACKLRGAWWCAPGPGRPDSRAYGTVTRMTFLLVPPASVIVSRAA